MKRTKEAVLQDIEFYKKLIKNFELDPDNYESFYIQHLNKINPIITINGRMFDPADVFRTMVPQTYQAELYRFIAINFRIEDDHNYQDLCEELKEYEKELKEIEGDIL